MRILSLTLLVGLGWLTAASLDRPQESVLEQADQAFREKTYSEALGLYRKAAASGRFADRAGHVHVRIGFCLARLGRQDEALKELGTFAGRAEKDLWKARALVERGVIALTMPHYYTEKEGKRHRGRWVQGGTYHNTQRQDVRQAVHDLEGAMALLDAVLAESPGVGKERPGVARSHFRCCTELAAGLERGRSLFGHDVEEGIVEKHPYLGLTSRTERVAWAFEHARAVQEGLGYRETAVLGGYLEAMSMNRYLRSLKHVTVGTDGVVSHRPEGEDGPLVALPEAWSPLKILKDVARKAEGLELEDDVLYALGRIRQQQGLFPGAVKALKRLLSRCPESPWAEDARHHVEQITFPRLALDTGRGRLPGEDVEIELTSRNVAEVELQVYRYPAEWFLGNDDLLRRSDVELEEVESLLAHAARDPYRRGRVATVRVETGDRGRHEPRRRKVRIPLTEPGTYLIEARGGELVYKDLLFISRIALIRHLDRDRSLVMAVDSMSGKPVADVNVVVRETTWRSGIFGRHRSVRVTSGRTGPDGTFRALRNLPEDQRRSLIEVGAWKDRSAAVVARRSSWVSRRSARMRGYVFTDRPVYRPGDDVSFAGVLRRESDDDLQPLSDAAVTVRIRDAKGKNVFEQQVHTDDTGAFDARIALGEEPPLGVYRIDVRRGRTRLGRGTFRVEEYKTPEFEVSVARTGGQARLGGSVAAEISARYYFGEPVKGGEVEYRVFRERFWPRFRPNEPFRFLYGETPRNVDPSDRGRGRELVASGEGELDDEGRLVIEWDSAPFRTRYPDQDSRFVVQADVTDPSRRTISGAARIPVTRTAVVAKVIADRGFYAVGETATIEVQTQTPSGSPVATEGRMRVYRVRQTREGRKVVDKLFELLEEKAHTDRTGTGFMRWTADQPGRFVVSYQTRDDWGELVRADVPFWVEGPEFDARGFQLKNLDLSTDRRHYEPGETMRVLVASNFADCGVLLCLVKGQRTLHEEVVRLEGKMRVVEIPVTEAAAPNVFIQAMSVYEGGFHLAQREILVPPVRQLLDVEVSLDKERYLPGEEGTATIETRDHRGRPVSARAALSCIDASVLYIQQDQTTDVRRFFHGNRSRARTSNEGSISFTFDGYLAEDADWGEYETLGWPAGWSLRPGLVSRILEGRGFGRDEHLTGNELVERKKSRSFDFDVAPRREARRRRGRGGLVEAERSAAPAARAPAEEGFAGRPLTDDAGDEGGGEAVPVRSDFRDTAVWAPDVRTGADGRGTVTVPFPDSLTRWRAKAVAWTRDTRVGVGTADVVTAKDLMVRLQAPRFFVEGDRIVLSALVNNLRDEPVTAQVRIDLAGEHLVPESEARREVEVPAGGDVNVDWPVRVLAAGEVLVRVSARSATDTDAMEERFPVLPWGAEKAVTRTEVVSDGGKAAIPLVVPEERRVESTRLEVVVQPSLAATLLDALPYLIRYPYGCTEQTISRFVPAVTAAATLREMGTSLEEIASRRRALANAGKLGVYEPVLSDVRLDDLVAAGLRRILGMQKSDGGFGWWRSDRSSPYLTAYALRGLLVARDAGYSVEARAVERAAAFLEGALEREENLHVAAYASAVLSRMGKADRALLLDLYRERDDLTMYGKALLARALKRTGEEDKAALVVEAFADFAREDEKNGTVHWDRRATRWWWRWWNNRIETNVAVLEALLDVDPGSRFTAPLVKWIVMNRQGNRWRNTRDTAQAVMGLCRYARRAGELDPDYTLTLRFAGRDTTFRVRKSNMFAFQNRLVLEADAVPAGESALEIDMEGRGRAYLTSRLSYFTQEEDIRGSGHEVLVARSYSRIEETPGEVEEDGRKVRRMLERRTPLTPGEDVASGTIVEVELEITTNNDYGYLVFEDMKPSGFEPLQLRSGRTYERGICSNVEFRDERTAFFVTWLEQGTHRLKYRMRAERPGKLRVLPARAEAMYAPRLGGISDSFRVTVTDRSGL